MKIVIELVLPKYKWTYDSVQRVYICYLDISC